MPNLCWCTANNRPMITCLLFFRDNSEPAARKFVSNSTTPSSRWWRRWPCSTLFGCNYANIFVQLLWCSLCRRRFSNNFLFSVAFCFSNINCFLYFIIFVFTISLCCDCRLVARSNKTGSYVVCPQPPWCKTVRHNFIVMQAIYIFVFWGAIDYVFS